MGSTNGGILTQPLLLSYYVFSDLHKNPHEYWRFLRFRILQLFQLFRMNSTNFGPKQTPKTPRPATPASHVQDKSYVTNLARGFNGPRETVRTAVKNPTKGEQSQSGCARRMVR